MFRMRPLGLLPPKWGMPMSIQSIPVATLGVLRIGPRREMKTALESYWSGKSDATALREAAAGIRAAI
jgi:5-methyltetrahydropteroyltriglutamate--homocysteine methyltransferase